MFSIIVAIAENYAIGKDNDLLCHLPADLKYFKSVTSGHTVIMGRRTFESLPNGPLPNRKNIVVTSSGTNGEVYSTVRSLDEAITLTKNEEEVFVIGGASVYRQSLDIANFLYVTWIHASFPADTYFPEINFDEWKEIAREDHESDEKNRYAYSFVKYKRV